MSKTKIFLLLDAKGNKVVAPDDCQLIVVRSYLAFRNYIWLEGVPDIISFDHDLADEHNDDYYYCDQNWMLPDENIIVPYNQYLEETGYDAAKWLVEYLENTHIPPPKCYVHSRNIIGAKNIYSYLNNYGKRLDGKKLCEYKYSYAAASAY